MKKFKKLSTYGAAFLMFVSMGAVVAEEGDMTRTRTQAQTQTQVHEYAGDSSQSQKLEQSQNRYNYRNNYKTQTPSMSKDSMGKQMNGSRSMGGGRR